MSISNCCFLACIQISQEAGQVVWYSHLLQNIPQFIVFHTVKGFGIVKKAEIDVFLELSCFFHDPVNMAIWSLVPLPFLKPAWASGSSRFMYCWSLVWRVWQLKPYKLYFLNEKTWRSKLLPNRKLQDEFVLAGMKIALVLLYTSIRVLGWSSVLSIFWKEYFFFWAVSLMIGLHIISKPCYKQCMFCYVDFVVLFYRHRQSRFLRILRGARIFRIANEPWFQLQVPSCVSP